MAYSPFALCVVIVVVCLVLAIGFATVYERAGYGYVSRSHVWRTCHPNVHHGWLLGIRVVGFLYCLSILIYDIALWGPFVFEYYTQWSFTLLILYFGIAIGSSIKEILHERNTRSSQNGCLSSKQTTLLSGYPVADEENASNEIALQSVDTYYKSEEAGLDGYVMQVFYQVALGAAFLTDLVYWTCIFPTYSFIDVIEISMHAMNLVFLLAELALNNMMFPWYRGAYFVMWTSTFIFFAWIIHALGEEQWPYPFLDVSTNLAPLWYFCLCIVHVIAFALVCGIVQIKGICLRHCGSSQA